MVDDGLTGLGNAVLWIVFLGMLASSVAFYGAGPSPWEPPGLD